MPVNRTKKNQLFPLPIDNVEQNTFHYETLAKDAGYKFIAGVDEAGRGPLAGPVTAAAVILSAEKCPDGIRDSKKMTAAEREKLFPLIIECSVSFSIAVVSHSFIDKHNILKATLEAMKQAVLALSIAPDFLLIDGNQPVPVNIRQRCIKKGDCLSKSISAASILAKVYRDWIMNGYNTQFPLYGFNIHKGYGTASHRNALRVFGPCPIHRMTFKGVLKDDKIQN